MASAPHVGISNKKPSEILDHSIDWANPEGTVNLATLDDPIVDFVAAIEPPGILAVWSSNFTEFDTTVFTSGGVHRGQYTVKHTVRTRSGRVFQRAVLVRCSD